MNTNDTKQQTAILRQSKTARLVRAKYPAGTRVTATPGAGANPRPDAMSGTVLRHVPALNAQGGHLTVRWDNGHTGRISPGSVVPAESYT
jgi:hypothetical protein